MPGSSTRDRRQLAMTGFEHLSSRRRWLAGCWAWSLAATTSMSNAQSAQTRHAHPANTLSPSADEFRVALPAVELLDHHGRRISLGAALLDGRAVMLNFIYTSCQAVCPLMARCFAEAQARLGSELSRVHMVSVTIDPEHDTAARLSDYAKSLGAGPQWDFYTGSLADCTAVQRAFDAYRGDKMNHVPATYLLGPGNTAWLRLQGLASPSRIVQAYIDLMGQCKTRDEAAVRRT
jgi:protein SCO1/2